MDLIFPIAGVVLLIGTPTYLHAVIKLGGIVQSEHPEWVDRLDASSFFYTDIPRITDPNVGITVLRVAFSPRWRMLKASRAPTYVWRIRILLPLLLVAFGAVFAAIAALKP